MVRLGRGLLFLALTLWCSVGFAADLTGSWEIQSMGADRDVKIQQRGEKIVAHRTLWPEFEGKKYKLEHLYRGTIVGEKIHGQLLVKEDEASEFEVLRDFLGSISGADMLVFDGMPVKRTGRAPALQDAPSEPEKKPAGPARPTDAPALSAKEPAKAPPPVAPAAKPEDEGLNLYSSIMGGAPAMENLFKVSAEIQIPDEASDLTADGDQLFAKGDARGALAKFEQARKVGQGSHVELLHRIGKCHLKLRQYADARAVLARALKLDPNNAAVRKDYDSAKRNGRA